MTGFTVVDIPKGAVNSNSSPLIEALQANVGKAISMPCGDRDANNMRKAIRASLANRGLLKKFTFHSRVDTANTALIVWIAEIPAPAAASETK